MYGDERATGGGQSGERCVLAVCCLVGLLCMGKKRLLVFF